MGRCCLNNPIVPDQKGTCLRVPTAESGRAIGGSGFTNSMASASGVQSAAVSPSTTKTALKSTDDAVRIENSGVDVFPSSTTIDFLGVVPGVCETWTGDTF